MRDAAGLARLLRRRPPPPACEPRGPERPAPAESRGAHFRVDFPAENPAFEGHVVLRPGAEAVVEQWS